MPNDPDRGSLGTGSVSHKPRSYTYGDNCAYEITPGSNGLPINFWRETVRLKSFRDTFAPVNDRAYSDEDIKQQNVHIARSVARYNGCLVVVGVVAAAISYFQWREIHDGSADTHTLAESAKNQSAYAKSAAATAREAYISENRAFIGPTEAALAPLEVGKGIKLVIAYKNTGREPVAVGSTTTVRGYDDRTQWNVYAVSLSQIMSDKEACMHADHPQNGFAFPNSGFSQYTLSLDTMSEGTVNKLPVSQSMIDGNTVIVVYGCMTYRTLKVVRHTAFCYFYKAKATPDPQHMSLCQNGWDAD